MMSLGSNCFVGVRMDRSPPPSTCVQMSLTPLCVDAINGP